MAWARVGGAPMRLRWLKVEGNTNVSGAAGGPMWVKAAPVVGGRTPEVRGGGARTVVVVAGTLCIVVDWADMLKNLGAVV
jgi:hypothetical protein